MIYLLWKDKNKPHYAKPALYSAIASLCFYGLVLSLYFIDM